MPMIKELIFLCQKGSVDAANELINRFMPLIKKYAYRAGSEDAFSELLTDFICLIKSDAISLIDADNDYVYIAYINRSVYHSFIRHKKAYEKSQRTSPMSSLSEEMLYKIELKLSAEDDYSILEFKETKKVLTEREYKLLSQLYIENVPVSEVADQLGISRQAVNQMKLNAVRKLKNMIM